MAKQKGRWLVRHGDWYIVNKSGSSNLYRARVNPQTGREDRYSLGTPDLQQAEQKLVEWLAEQYRPKNAPVNEVSLAWVLLDYYNEYGCKLTTNHQCKISFKYWVDWWKESTVAEITLRKQQEFISHLRAAGKSDGYISRILNDGRAAIQRAYKHSLIQSAPFIMSAQSAESKRLAPPKGRPLQIQELARLFDAVRSEHLKRFCILLLTTMVRPNAALELTENMVNWEYSYINFLPNEKKQTNKRRPIIPIIPVLKPWLKEWSAELEETRKKAREQNKHFNLCHFVHYRNFPVEEIDSAWKIARAIVWPDTTLEPLPETSSQKERNKRAMQCNDLGKLVNPYSIRHTLSRDLRRKRVPGEEISIMLGHKPVNESDTTLIYSPYDPDYCQTAIKALDEYCQELNSLMTRWKIIKPDAWQETGK